MQCPSARVPGTAGEPAVQAGTAGATADSSPWGLQVTVSDAAMSAEACLHHCTPEGSLRGPFRELGPAGTAVGRRQRSRSA